MCSMPLFPAAPFAAYLRIGLLIDLELDIDGRDRHDGGQHRGRRAVAHQVARGDFYARDTRPVTGEAIGGVIEIDLGSEDGGLGSLHVGVGFENVVVSLVEFALRNGMGLDQLLVTIEVGFRQRELRLRSREGGLGMREVRLKRTGIDGEEEIALFDELTFLEMDRLDNPRHLRTDGDAVNGPGRVRRIRPIPSPVSR